MSKLNDTIKARKQIELSFNMEQGMAPAAATAFCGPVPPETPYANTTTDETGAALK